MGFFEFASAHPIAGCAMWFSTLLAFVAMAYVVTLSRRTRDDDDDDDDERMGG